MREEESSDVKVQFVPVGRSRREWMWKVRDDTNMITISGQRFESLSEAVRDARSQIDSRDADPDESPDGPFAA
jgi:hypothetical protein